LNTNYQGNINYPNREYYFRFTPSATRDYTITNNSSPYPIVVLIYDNNGNWLPDAMKILLTGEDMICGFNSGQTYHIGIKFAGPSPTGQFDIKIN